MANQQLYQVYANNPLTPALTDVVPFQPNDAGATEMGANTWGNVLNAFSIPKTVKISLSSAQILQLFTTPVELVAPQGANTFIQPISAVYNYTYGTITYTTNVLLAIGYNPVVTGSITSTTILGAAQNRLQRSLFASGNTFVISSLDPINNGLYAQVQTGDPLAGDGTLDIYLTYIVINL